MSAPLLPDFLSSAPPGERERFRDAANLARWSAGLLAIGWRSQPEALVFPTAGVVRVFLPGQEGREITLYRVEPGSSCVLSASCILGGSMFPAMAEVEREVVAWVVPAAVFRRWVGESAYWRDFVFRLLGERLGAVLAKLEETTFDRVDARIARRLLQSGPKGKTTHQQLANEIGTAREVVSRILSRWRERGWIESTRATLTVLDVAAIAAVAEIRE